MGLSLDAIAAIPRGDGSMPVMEGEWGLPPEPPDLTELKLAWLREADAHLMGRITYEAMAGHWPTSTHAYAAIMNDIPKIVFSRTLDRADWPDSQIARRELADEIARLEARPRQGPHRARRHRRAGLPTSMRTGGRLAAVPG